MFTMLRRTGLCEKPNESSSQLLTAMKKYLIRGKYNAEGNRGLLQEGGSGRQRAIEHMLTTMSGRVEAFYYGLGQNDVYLIVELPEEVAAAAVTFRVNAAGLVRISLTPLLTPAEMDEAAKMSVSYRAPGAS